MSKIIFPLQFERQYSGPLDIHQVFNTSSDRIAYLSNPLRYAAQIVSDLQTQKCYQLSTDTNNWIEIGGTSLSLLSSLSANWDSVYTSVLNTSANWDSVYAFVSSNSSTYATYNYVDSNFLNLTGGTIDGNLSVLSSFKVGGNNAILFVSGGKVGVNTELPAVELTVSGSISASNKIYGTIIDWMTLTRGFKIEPVFNSTIAGGDIYTYVYESSPSDKTYYRYIATDGSEDAYYENFSGGILSNLVAKKQIII
jgi:hypothetical protein